MNLSTLLVFLFHGRQLLLTCWTERKTRLANIFFVLSLCMCLFLAICPYFLKDQNIERTAIQNFTGKTFVASVMAEFTEISLLCCNGSGLKYARHKMCSKVLNSH